MLWNHVFTMFECNVTWSISCSAEFLPVLGFFFFVVSFFWTLLDFFLLLSLNFPLIFNIPLCQHTWVQLLYFSQPLTIHVTCACLGYGWTCAL